MHLKALVLQIWGLLVTWSSQKVAKSLSKDQRTAKRVLLLLLPMAENGLVAETMSPAAGVFL
jgi:hypothetical protein